MSDLAQQHSTIRIASQADLPAVVELFEQHARFEQASFIKDGLIDKLTRCIQGSQPRLVIHVVELNDELVGYAASSREFSSWSGEDYLHLDCLYVIESMRDKKIGRSVFATVVNHAKQSGLNQIQWQTPDWNTDAIRFYESRGAFSKSKTRFYLDLSVK